MPDFKFETVAIKAGYNVIAGLDEVGRGCLAGPLVAASVVLPLGTPKWIAEIDDSKKLSAKSRSKMSDIIKNYATAWSVGVVQAYQVDDLGLTKATELAMKQSLDSMSESADYLLIDYVPIQSWGKPFKIIKQGDSKSFTIAAASIIAKVYRDDIMIGMDVRYPQYGFASNKGYGTKKHMDSLSIYGPCDIHRRSFSPVYNSLKSDVIK
tara:strand:+ start:812 stop:1438 length:627 start_codon:yes stop_codon:yes gene_type:complete